jgi:hypothetical protein
MRNAHTGIARSAVRADRARNRSALVRMWNYYRVFRTQAGPVKSLYFAFRLTM